MVTNQQREKNYEKNVIVGQSGGPTAVINASLAGVYKTAKDMGADTIYGNALWHSGFVGEKIVDLGEKIRKRHGCGTFEENTGFLSGILPL